MDSKISNNTEGEILSPEELARHLSCGRTYVYELLRAGDIPSFKLGRLRRVRKSDADDFISKLLTSEESARKTT